MLKAEIKNKNDEILKIKSESKDLSKSIKQKEKEAYNLENKTENLKESVRTLKVDNAIMKNENKRLVKAKLQVTRKSEIKTSSSASNNTAGLYPCDLCSSTFVHTARIESHVETRAPDLALEYSCDFCEQKFAVFKNMLLHVKNCHGDISLNRIDLNHNKPPDISDTTSDEAGTKDNVMEMSAEELSTHFHHIILGSILRRCCITNVRRFVVNRL